MPSRRNVLIGLGGIVVGGGALMSTGAFTTVEAQRTVNVETATDANAFLALTPANSTYVQETDGTIEINLDSSPEGAQGINQNGITSFDDLVEITNNGSQDITSLTFEFDVQNAGGDETGIEEALSIRAGGQGFGEGEVGETDDITDTLTMGGDDANALDVGEGVVFGLRINLIDYSDGEIPDTTEITLTIIANTD